MDNLTNEELMLIYRKSTAKDKQKLESYLTKRNKNLIDSFSKIAYNKRNYFSQNITLDEIRQECSIGFLQAVRRWEPGKKTQLTTLAWWWMRDAHTKLVNRESFTIRLPANKMSELIGKKATKEVRDEILDTALRFSSMEYDQELVEDLASSKEVEEEVEQNMLMEGFLAVLKSYSYHDIESLLPRGASREELRKAFKHNCTKICKVENKLPQRENLREDVKNKLEEAGLAKELLLLIS